MDYTYVMSLFKSKILRKQQEKIKKKGLLVTFAVVVAVIYSTVWVIRFKLVVIEVI